MGLCLYINQLLTIYLGVHITYFRASINIKCFFLPHAYLTTVFLSYDHSTLNLIFVFFKFPGPWQWWILTLLNPNTWQPGDQGNSHSQIQGRSARTYSLIRTTFKLKIQITPDLPITFCLGCFNSGSRGSRTTSPHTTWQCAQ